MPPLSIPTPSPLSSSLLLPSSHPSIIKTLSRLSRTSLLSLILDWLDPRNSSNSSPYLLSSSQSTSTPEPDPDDLYPPASSASDLRSIYEEMQVSKGTKRDVLDRVLTGDWRNGISLYMLAMADMQYLYSHPLSQKWSALKIIPLSTPPPDSTTDTKKELPNMPRFHPSTFLRNLEREALPDVRTHYNLDRHPSLPLLILRVFILESPYTTTLSLSSTKPSTLFDSSRTFYIAFPDSSPYIYVSLTNNTVGIRTESGGSSDGKSLRKLILEGVPKAFSRRGERWRLEGTQLSARNLEAIVERRGGRRTNAAGGGWGVYMADEGKGGENNPLNIQLPTPEASILEDEAEEEKETGRKEGLKRKRADPEEVVKRRKLIAKGRFGNSAKKDDGLGIERLDIRLEDPFPSSLSSTSTSTSTSTSDPLLPSAPKPKRKGRKSDIEQILDHSDNEQDEDESEEQRREQREGSWKPDIRITFHGTHIFAGVREMVEQGVVDGREMPGWLTGEEGVSVGVVRGGRVRGFKGSGV